MMSTRSRVICGLCHESDEITTCGNCEGVWCDRCDPAHGPLCPWCHGMGYSTAAIKLPRYRQANHGLPSDSTVVAITPATPCHIVPDGVDTNGDEWNRCTVHGYDVFGDAYICEGYRPEHTEPPLAD